MKRFSTTPLLTVIGFAATGLFSFGLACVIILVRPDSLAGDPVRGPVLALTHLITLGWIGSLLFGGAYLVGPLLADSPLWSRRLPVLHWVTHLLGLALMLGGFFIGRYDAAAVGSALIFIGLTAMVVNLVATGARKSVWAPANVVFQTALFWLAVTGGLALFMLRGRLGGASPLSAETLIGLHAHYALLGFLAQVLLGVSLRLVPELLGRVSSGHRLDFLAWTGWTLLNTGLLALAPATMSGSVTGLVGVGAVIFIGLLGLCLPILGCLWSARRNISWAAITHVSGIVLLIALMAGALWRLPGVASGSLEESREWMRFYISMALLGPFSLAILGTGGHMIPRLVWNLRFGPWAERGTLPAIGSLGRRAASGPAYLALLIALIYLGLGQWLGNPEAIRLGGILMLLGFGWFVFSIAPAVVRLVIGVTPEDLGEVPPPTPGRASPPPHSLHS